MAEMLVNELEKDVKQILKNIPASRASDDLLYVTLIEKRLAGLGRSLERISAKDYLLHYRNYNLPTIESVGRCRRKLQEKDETLKPSEKVQLTPKGNAEQFCQICNRFFGVDILSVDNKENMC